MPCDYGCAFVTLRGYFGDTFTRGEEKCVVRAGVVRVCLVCGNLEVDNGAVVALLKEEKLPHGAPV